MIHIHFLQGFANTVIIQRLCGQLGSAPLISFRFFHSQQSGIDPGCLCYHILHFRGIRPQNSFLCHNRSFFPLVFRRCKRCIHIFILPYYRAKCHICIAF
jgi:hypothetical protein